MNQVKTTVVLMGGVGNRLFQLARAIDMRDVGIDITVIELPKFIEKSAKLFGWSYHQQWLNLDKLVSQLGIKKRKANRYEVLLSLMVYISRKVKINSYPFNQELRDIHLPIPKITLGYFQSLSHVNIRSLDRIALELIKLLNIKQLDHKVVHVRGGDFNHKDRISPINLMKILFDNKDIYIVTNDLASIQKIFEKNKGLKLFSSKCDLEDFIFLSSANEIYPTKSTYSFWAAKIIKINGGKVNVIKSDQFWQMI
jgi:hypothetical protein